MSAEHDQEVDDRQSPSGKEVHDAIKKEGEDELKRPSSALAWSALAAGLSMGFSFLGPGLLRAYLPDATWLPLVASLGYVLGFVIVILGRQQLFTENTLTVMLPLMEQRDRATARNVLRLWGVVLAGNLVGAALFGLVIARTEAMAPEVYVALKRMAVEAIPPSFEVSLLGGVFAGWLIALVVWLLPFAESARLWVIVIVTYVVGLAGMSHVIVGAVDASFLVASGGAGLGEVLRLIVLPALLGNILGGVALVAALNHAQVVAGGGEDV
jgi:formate/nitrite transporter FocA (FNT family)